MNQSKLGNMKKSLLLSRDISLKDIFEHNEKLSTKKSGIALSENKTS
jgi:hypothetical protein